MYSLDHLIASHERALEPRIRVAASVMLQSDAEDLSIQPGAAEMKLARKNAVGLEFISHFPSSIALIEEEQSRLAAFRRTMQQTSSLLADHDIPHIYIKFRKLYHYYDSNVDVIVAMADWRSAVAALQAEGYNGNVMFKEPDKIMFSRAGQSVSVHLHPGVTWNGVPYFDIDDLWSHSYPSSDGPWRELTDDYDYLINLAHNVFENYEISLGDMLYFRRFLRGNSLDEKRLESVATVNGWRRGFQQIHAQVKNLTTAWDQAERDGHLPQPLLSYPYDIPFTSLVGSFGERIAHNVFSNRYKLALREVYAYPSFYLLNRRHDLKFLSR